MWSLAWSRSPRVVLAARHSCNHFAHRLCGSWVPSKLGPSHFPGYDRIESPTQAMSTGRTSTSHPLRIDSVSPGDGFGRIGITSCPGKREPAGLAGDPDLDRDLDEIQCWGATAMISLITDQEIDSLQVHELSEAVQDRHMEWWHLPIPDMSRPGPDFESGWRTVGEAIRDRLQMGFLITHQPQPKLGGGSFRVGCQADIRADVFCKGDFLGFLCTW